jgi:hypothetical protein
VEARHYSDAEWIEFAAGRAGEKATAMAAHAEVCEACRTWLSTCKELAHVAETETASRNLSQWIHETIAGFTPAVTKAPKEVFSGLISDTYLNTHLGIRAALVSERRVSFESDGYVLEMTMDVSHHTLKRVIGHLIEKSARTPAAGRVADLKVSAKTYSTKTNASGEFYFELDEKLTGDPVEIRFQFGDNPCLIALLPF